MDTPDNYYAILGVPIDADLETIKRAYRQLARRYHPDLAGPEGATQMKRINRAYDVLGDAEKRLHYDTIIGGIIDLRKGGGLVRPRPVQRKFEPSDDIEFSGLSIFSTRGPFRAASMLRTQFGVVSSLGSAQTERGLVVAAGSLDGKGILWQVEQSETPTSFAADPALPVESLRELRISPSGRLAAGWGRLGMHVWNTGDGSLLWSYNPGQRAVSAHYSLDIAIKDTPDGGEVWMALPLLREDPRAPRSQGVRGTDAIRHALNAPADELSAPLVCAEDEIEKRQFWAIRLRALTLDAQALLTLSCAHIPGEANEQVVVRRWDIQARAKTRFREKLQPRILTSFTTGSCADCTPPYVITPDGRLLAFVSTGKMIRLLDTLSGTFSELASGTMGASSRLAISPDGQWVAVAREDSEINEGVIDMWSVERGEIAQKLYHPWQISALHFAPGQLLAALTDGTLQIWKS